MPFLIAIAGGSGSGKSTLAATLMAALPEGSAAFLSEDWYYADVGAAEGFDPATYDFDDLPVRDHARLVQDLRALRAGEAVQAPAYDFVTHRRRADHATPVEPRRVIVAEGAHLLCSPAVVALFDLKVFVDTPPDVRFIRRLIRDQAERGRTAQSVIDQYLQTVPPGPRAAGGALTRQRRPRGRGRAPARWQTPTRRSCAGWPSRCWRTSGVRTALAYTAELKCSASSRRQLTPISNAGEGNALARCKSNRGLWRRGRTSDKRRRLVAAGLIGDHQHPDATRCRPSRGRPGSRRSSYPRSRRTHTHIPIERATSRYERRERMPR